MKTVIFIILFIQLSPAHADDSQPMFGGMERSDPELLQKDHLFIDKAIQTFGTSEHASIGYVDSGFEAHLQDKDELAMQRFNEAWLLNKDNPYVYIGFGVLYEKHNQMCQAMDMFRLANEKKLNEPDFLADYALIKTRCGITLEEPSRSTLLSEAENIYQLAEQTPNDRVRAYIYHSWAKADLLINKAESAIDKTRKAQSLGFKVDESLSNETRALLIN